MSINKNAATYMNQSKNTTRARNPRRIMFPSTHDLFPEHLDVVTGALRSWLESENQVLIVTKPHYDVVKHLCRELRDLRAQIVFRFTIGSMNNDVLSFWEPGAPTYDERYESLCMARGNGFATSVSCEPYLDNKIYDLVEAVSLFVTDSVWIGKMNRVGRRVNTEGWSNKDRSFLHRVFDAQSTEFIKDLYERLKDRPQVRWKDSIKKVLELPEEEIG
jgi:DNA repair photolyase